MQNSSPGRRVIQIREYFGLKQGKFSEEIGMSQTNVSRVESEEIKPSRAFLSSVKDRFGVDPEWIKTGEGDMWITPESYLKSGIELLGKEKMAAGIANLVQNSEFQEVTLLVSLNKMIDSSMPKEMVKYLEYIINTWQHGDEKTRNWLEMQLEISFQGVKGEEKRNN